MNVIVTYEFGFTAEGKPRSYLYSILMEGENNASHSETFLGFDHLEFERLRESVLAQGLPLTSTYTNHATKEYSETYYKSWK